MVHRDTADGAALKRQQRRAALVWLIARCIRFQDEYPEGKTNEVLAEEQVWMKIGDCSAGGLEAALLRLGSEAIAEGMSSAAASPS